MMVVVWLSVRWLILYAMASNLGVAMNIVIVLTRMWNQNDIRIWSILNGYQINSLSNKWKGDLKLYILCLVVGCRRVQPNKFSRRMYTVCPLIASVLKLDVCHNWSGYDLDNIYVFCSSTGVASLWYLMLNGDYEKCF